MKRIFSLILLSILVLSGCEKNLKSDIVSYDKAENIIVYITDTGECYHKSDCYNLRKSKIKITLDEAVEQYKACHNCYPPIIDK